MNQIVSEEGFIPDAFADTLITSLAEYSDAGALLLLPEEDISIAAHHFDTLDLIVISFVSSADGRGFSQARGLRALGYNGHLRARGHVLVDQFRAALRCGFDDVEISDQQALRNPEAQWRSIPLGQSYQSYITHQEIVR